MEKPNDLFRSLLKRSIDEGDKLWAYWKFWGVLLLCFLAVAFLIIMELHYLYRLQISLTDINTSAVILGAAVGLLLSLAPKFDSWGGFNGELLMHMICVLITGPLFGITAYLSSGEIEGWWAVGILVFLAAYFIAYMLFGMARELLGDDKK